MTEIKDGPFEEYYENGQLKSKGTYKDGKLDGLYEMYCLDGKPSLKYTYKDGKLDGTFEKYWPNEQLKGKGIYKDGKLEGPYEKGIYKDGKLEGPYERYWPDGKLKEKSIYKDGELDGPFELYYENGQLYRKRTYKDGKLDGPSEEYYKNGQLCEKYTYKDGKLDGPCEEYHGNGQLHVKYTCKDGKREGLCEVYNGNGALIRMSIYENDQEIDRKDRFLTPEEVLPDWEKKHPNPTTEDFLGYMYGTGGNVVTCLVRAGSETLEKFFPVDKWATMKAIPELKKIFATVPHEKDLMDTMRKFDSKLRTTYNLNQRRAERKKQHDLATAKKQGNLGDGR